MSVTTQELPIVKSLEISRGNRSDNPEEWTSFEWHEPMIGGSQTKGEVLVIRPEGSTGSLSAGLWRTSPLAAGCRPDGSVTIDYSTPLGDETVLLLEGEVEITVKKTGKKHRIKAGDIMSHPKDLEITWDIKGPFLKKFWVIWDSPVANAPVDDVYVGSANGNGEGWVPFEWEEPLHGPSKEGEILVVRDRGATGFLQCGLWRTGLHSPAKNADGGCDVKYSSPLGDETFILLEGEAVLTVVETGEQYPIKAGDIVGHPKNLDVLWSIKSPFLKKFWVITDASPASIDA